MLKGLKPVFLLIPGLALMLSWTSGAHMQSQASDLSQLSLNEELLLELDPALERPAAGVAIGLHASPDGKRIAIRAKRNGKHVLVLDGKDSAPVQELAFGLFSPDSQHYAYCVKRAGQWIMVVDEKEGEGSQNLGWPLFSPDSKRLAFWRMRGGKTVMNVDGKEGPEFEKIGYSAFSPDSKRFAYATKKLKGKWVMILDGQEGPELEDATFPVFSPDSKRFAYAARQGGWRIVVDGKEGQAFRSVTIPTFSPDSLRFAYNAMPDKLEHETKVTIVRNLTGGSVYTSIWVPVVDGQLGELNLILAGPVFSPDSKHVAYAAGDHVKSTLYVDGQKVRDFSERRKGRLFLVRNLIFSPDSKRVACALAEGGHAYMNTIMQTGNEGGQAQRRVVVDGQEGKEYDVFSMLNLSFSPDSQHVAYVVQGFGKSFVVIDGHEGKPYDEILWGSFSFTSSESVIFVAREGRKLYRVTQSLRASKRV